MIRTVLGDIEPERIGITYAHEHLLATPPAWKAREDPDLVILDEEAALEEAEAFRAAGGTAMYEATAWDYGRDAAGLRRIAERTGLHIVATAGMNKGLWFEDRAGDWSVEEFEALMVAELEEGIGDSGVRAGVVKFGTGLHAISPAEERALRAAARAHRRTGAPLHSHTEAGTMGLEQLELLREEGVEPRRLAMAHLTRHIDPGYHREVAASGAFICIDQISKVKYGPESERIGMLIDLWEAGHGDQLLLGGDLARQSDLTAYSGGPGLRYGLEVWVPLLEAELGERGVGAEETAALLHAVLVANPRRYLTWA